MPARYGRQKPSRAVAHPPTTRVTAGSLTPYVRFREPLRSTDSQGIGRAPGQRAPHKRVGFSLVKGFGKMIGRLHPDPRFTVAVEKSGWSKPRYYEHRNRHTRPRRNVIREPNIAPTLTETVAAKTIARKTNKSKQTRVVAARLRRRPGQ